MRLRFSILATIVAATYALVAGALAISEAGDCMGWCMALATFPEVFLLGALPTEFFYSPIWTGFLMQVFALGVISANAFILYVIFGGLKWWPDNL
ncbi:MAG: hypothetical protein ACXWHZ_12765 [Usitatibacter sp.]